MRTLLEIAAAIQELPEGEVRELSTWLQSYLDERWDRQLEGDVRAGRLDHLIASMRRIRILGWNGWGKCLSIRNRGKSPMPLNGLAAEQHRHPMKRNGMKTEKLLGLQQVN
ncbi:hypothetical protein E1H13_06420 [Nodosilinea sp. P-1105]|nr:hypothetical protein [Nodosilinea sp. P-1105]